MDAARGDIESALDDALKGVTTTPADDATIALARAYARSVDCGEDLSKIGPALLACLKELGMTPAARAALTKGEPREQERRSPLDELRQRREQRTG
jgi:hypothetical protein